ncbi:PQQ-dependent sugar dehydrogenase [Flexibacterium corallicola]|uniref:PQQ-dependent sugar dehydrogenase n=1 Tax=Flexibacterium corallicola TaxID=3037259 RepID=UPI00286F15F3|nr:PQQ-dependent sugar dehydrogenase [Pseudovibrio sp. M1P-2-3]
MERLVILLLVCFVGGGLPDEAAALGLPEARNVDVSKPLSIDREELGPVEQRLKAIEMPAGFHIELFAQVPYARHMAISPDGTTVFVGTRGEDLWLLPIQKEKGELARVRSLGDNLDLDMPNGPCFSGEGDLFVSERNRVLVFPQIVEALNKQDAKAIEIVPQGTLIPPSEESGNHSARVCRVGPDGRLYISLGQPYNVSPISKLELYQKLGIGGIISMEQDGTDRLVYTTGVRNSVGMDFHPRTQELWFTDNQVDGMGDDIPPGELNRQTEAGQDFGFPWYGGGAVKTERYKNIRAPDDVIFPEVEMDAHAADLGMTFYKGEQFPRIYRGGIFNAQHGSWDRSEPIGARVMFTEVNDEGRATSTSVFAEGWLGRDGEYWGRPVDTAELPDGSLLVSDDRAGAIYRIWYSEPE